jgi:hypothetical protein
VTKFIAQLNDGSFININADEMVLEDTSIRVFRSGKLVAYLDVGACIVAHLSEKAVDV